MIETRFHLANFLSLAISLAHVCRENDNFENNERLSYHDFVTS
jgi:hypothetical protein